MRHGSLLRIKKKRKERERGKSFINRNIPEFIVTFYGICTGPVPGKSAHRSIRSTKEEQGTVTYYAATKGTRRRRRRNWALYQFYKSREGKGRGGGHKIYTIAAAAEAEAGGDEVWSQRALVHNRPKFSLRYKFMPRGTCEIWTDLPSPSLPPSLVFTAIPFHFSEVMEGNKLPSRYGRTCKEGAGVSVA